MAQIGPNQGQIGPSKDQPNNFCIKFHRFEAEIGLHGSQKELHGSQKELEDLSIKKWVCMNHMLCLHADE